MTLTIDLKDRAWFDAIPVDGIGVHVVEGVPVGDSTQPRYPGPGEHVTHSTPVEAFIAPPEWVALSEQKCETCGGTKPEGATYGDHWNCVEFGASQDQFILCANGRPLVRVTVPCEMEWWPGEPCDGTIPDKDGDLAGYCDRCKEGRVSIGSVTVEAVEDRGDGTYNVIVRRRA